MTGIAKDQITSVAISIRVDGKPSFMLLLAKEGTVKRMGFSALFNDERTVATGHDGDFFDAFMEEVPEALLSRGGTYEAEGAEGDRCTCRIEFGGGPEPISFELTYYSHSAGLPAAMAELIATAERVTDEWYAGFLESEPEAKDASEEATDGVVEDDSGEEGPAATERVGTPHPSATRQRIGLVVLLDFLVLGVPYQVLRAPFVSGGAGEGGLPGGALVLFALVEFVLLYLVRMSPGYWMLGMRAKLGDVPRVDPGHLSRESLLTHAVGVVLLATGADGVTSWIGYHTPVPYFGFALGPVLSIIFTMLLGIAAAAAGVLILRNDLRGVWVGAGFTAFGFLALWFGRELMGDYIVAELTNRSAYQGRPVQAGEFESARAFLRPLLLAAPLLYGAGLFGVWKKLRPATPVDPV